MIKLLKTSEGKFLALVLLIAVFIAFKVVKLPISGEVNVTIYQQKGAINNLDSPKKISSEKRLTVPTVNFVESRDLTHKDFGLLGFKSNFFMNVSTKADILKDGNYTFSIASDDGFRFKIDDTVVCEHPGNRPFKQNKCHFYLSKGIHSFALSYYQGAGPMGFKARYSLHSKPYFIGEDSKYMTFKATQ